jgi:hypothetical protein
MQVCIINAVDDKGSQVLICQTEFQTHYFGDKKASCQSQFGKSKVKEVVGEEDCCARLSFTVNSVHKYSGGF